MTHEQKGATVTRVLSTDELDIVAEVNAELAESMARIQAAGEPPRQGDQAHDEFLELVIYGNKIPAVSDFLHQFFRSGAGVIRVRVDPEVTNGAMRKVFRYDLEESLKKVLLALRAGDFVNWNVAPVDIHSESSEMSNDLAHGRAAVGASVWSDELERIS